MFRRTQTSLLSVMAAAFFAAVALLPSAASAAGNCFANPAGAAPAGKHWYYRLHRATEQKCWYLGAKRSTVRTVALRKPSKPLVASARLQSPLPPSIADAPAKVRNTSSEAPTRNEIAMSETSVVKEVTYEDLLKSTFGSRWADPVDVAGPSSSQSRPYGETAHRRPLVIASLEAKPFEAADRLVANGSSPADALAILLVTAGSLLVLLGLFGSFFLSQRDQSSDPEYPSPLRLSGFGSASEDRVPAAAEPDSYGIRSAARQVRPSIGDGTGSGHAATPPLTSDKKRARILANVARESQRLAEPAVE